MAKKDGMYCYYDWLKPLERVPAEDFKALFIAMMRYSLDDTQPPEFEGITGMAADFIFPQIARSKKYAENGQKGGNATQAKTNGSTNGSTLIHNTKTKTNTETKTYTTPSGGVGVAGFETFWNVYPKKAGKEAAKAAFESLSLSDTDFAELMELVRRWKDSGEWKREMGRFVKQAAKFLEEIFPERVNPPDYNEDADGFWNEAIEAEKRRRIGDKNE